MQKPSFSHKRPRFGCRRGTFSPSRRQVRRTRLAFTRQPSARSIAVTPFSNTGQGTNSMAAYQGTASSTTVPFNYNELSKALGGDGDLSPITVVSIPTMGLEVTDSGLSPSEMRYFLESFLPPGEIYGGKIDAEVFGFADSDALAETLAAQVNITNMVYPYTTVVHLTVRWPTGDTGFGSGVMVGPNDVLTAGHVIYNAAQGGAATSITAIPFWSPANPNARPFGEAQAVGNGWTTIDPNYQKYGPGPGSAYDAKVHGLGSVGDGAAGTLGGSELDWGFITLNKNLGRLTNWMVIDPSFVSGPLHQSGYPHYVDPKVNLAYFTDEHHYSARYASRDGGIVYSLDLRPFETFGGNSGRPLWQMKQGSPYAYVVGVVSTEMTIPDGTQYGSHKGLAGYNVAANYDYFQKMIAANDHLAVG